MSIPAFFAQMAIMRRNENYDNPLLLVLSVISGQENCKL